MAAGQTAATPQHMALNGILERIHRSDGNGSCSSADWGAGIIASFLFLPLFFVIVTVASLADGTGQAELSLQTAQCSHVPPGGDATYTLEEKHD